MKNNRIDLILADINMPQMNGLEFCRQAKELDHCKNSDTDRL